MSNLRQIGERAWSYNTAIKDVLPDGRTIGNVTKYSSTTSTHQNRVGAKSCAVTVDNVPEGTDNLAQWYADQQAAQQPKPTLTPDCEAWVKWLEAYGAANFYQAFMRNAQGAEGTCRYCGETIQLDIREGGGVPDWHFEGDYGCYHSPWNNDEGTGGHWPEGCDPEPGTR